MKKDLHITAIKNGIEAAIRDRTISRDDLIEIMEEIETICEATRITQEQERDDETTH